ncbi:PspA-associated protein PspAB [Streptomyces sparsus]
MGFLDALFGRRKPARPDLDQLFALPSAAITLETGGGFAPTGLGSVCFAGVEGGAFSRLQDEVRQLLGTAEFSQDSFGYTWVLCRHAPEETASLVNDLHAVNTYLQDAGFGPQLLCSLVGFRDENDRSLALVYLYKRGTFYPFAPLPGGGERRDNALELQTKALLTEDLTVEQDLSRWFPVWGAPGL